MIVMKHYENGNLYQYLDHCNGILSWRDIIDMLWGIAGGLERIHAEGKVHGNLHGGNLLVEDEKVSTDARIGDVGLHGPCDDGHKKPNQIYGVLPFIAPEVLRVGVIVLLLIYIHLELSLILRQEKDLGTIIYTILI